jgi:hypothetical protein
VPDERVPLGELPADGQHRADAGDQEPERPRRPDLRPQQQHADAGRQQEPVAEVVGVVPPAQAVVQVEAVAGHVDEERRHDQPEPGPRQRRIRFLPGTGGPASLRPDPRGRHQQHQHRVRHEPGAEALALELRQPVDERRHRQLHHRGRQHQQGDDARDRRCHQAVIEAVTGASRAGRPREP